MKQYAFVNSNGEVGHTISPALAALCIVYALQMGGVFQYGTRLIAETEALMTSVERLTHFESAVKEEKNLKKNDHSWKCRLLRIHQ